MHGGKKPHKKSNSKLNIFSQNSLDNLYGHRKESMYKSSNDHTTMTVQIKLFVGVEKLFYM